MILKAVFVLMLIVKVYCASPPSFSDSYSVRGTLYIPYAEIEEPFYAWFDLKLGASRIDYYGDMVKTFQLSKSSKYGTSIKVAPVSTDTQLNKQTCLQVNGTDKFKIEPQAVLPDLSDFQLIGKEVVNGVSCEKWRFVDKIGAKVNKYTMWIYYKGAAQKPPQNMVAIPVRYEMKGYNSLLGSHYDHYYLEYDEYSDSPPNPNVFQIPANMTCTSFPGPGSKHIYTFNPMKEFVHNYDKHVDKAFEEFKHIHKKSYVSDIEHSQRKELFRQNMRFIHSKNRANVGYTLAVNHLADRTDLELQALRGRKYTPGYNGGQPFPYNVSVELKNGLPSTFDWRLYGAVTPVKDQSVCGSCWSFGTTGAIEGAFFVTHGYQVRLSQQALIDCSWGYGNNGCDGGEDFRSYQWMMKHGGLPTEDEYGPYLGQDGYCHVDNITLTAKITGYVNVTPDDANALKVALLKHGPISVAIDASHKSFTFYSNGVYFDPKCGNTPDELDHAVLLVGYGALGDKKYWLVKNSWSTYWGNDGYILMSPKENNCGVMTSPTYVTM
ncbi:digestive cysteine proteinase 1 [Schistocerca gregaria]|uniref:digestive cysteine proteinase 1 n=1 Tax=Schistocerca gregaria TaxID=7010 RepID=UPI00211E43BB|nr:digestive cysteine proteinase 1 [Schistocerca gregaria]